ncbi:MAG: hypothetical protein GYA51_11850 [Candidatus Methanofastidiosa archaeon]|nr:hypothetical protein [Candidatus Methanofastidiosa archaeon]
MIDEENVLSNINGNICIKKENSNFYIIFSNDDIDIGPNFIDTIKTSIINNEKKKIYHAGVKLSETPITIGKMEIFLI